MRCLAALALLLSGCQLRFPLRNDANIACEADTDCPSGMSCPDALGRCVVVGADIEAPTVTDVVVSTLAAARGRSVEVSFTASEALEDDPSVYVGDPAASTFKLLRVDGLRYTYALTPGDADASGAWPILARLLDTSGNSVNNLQLATLTFDFEAPRVLGTSLALLDTPASPFAVSAMGAQARASVSLAYSEPLATAPEIVAVCAGLSVTLAVTDGGPNQSYFTAELDGSMVAAADDGECELLASFADSAGNTVRDWPTGLVVMLDRTPPSSTAWVDMLKIVWAPWGATQTAEHRGPLLVPADLPSSAVIAGVLARGESTLPASLFAEMGEQIEGALVLDGEGSSATRTGLITRHGDQLTASFFGTAGGGVIYVQPVDRAGNVLASPARIERIEWIATLGGKRAGSFTSNPHQLLSHRFMMEELSSPDAVELDDASGAIDGAVERVTGGVTFRKFDTTMPPFLPSADTVVSGYDPTRGRLVFIDPNVGQAWEFNGFRLQPVTDIDNDDDGWPSGLKRSAVAYDSHRNVLVFAGGVEGAVVGRFWELDGKRWNLRCDAVPSADSCSPIGRASEQTAAAYDSLRGVSVFYGGNTSADDPNVYEWDGQTLTTLAPTGVTGVDFPAPRYGAAMGFDPSLGEVLLFGGSIAGYSLTDELWAWNGIRWRQLPSDVTWPTARFGAAFVYHPIRRSLLLVGGQPQYGYCDDVTPGICHRVWEYRDGVFTRIDTVGAAPTVNLSGGYFDVNRGQVVLYNAGGNFEAWEWRDTGSGAQYTQLYPVTSTTPPARMRGRAEAWAPSGLVLLFGGRDNGNTQLSDTWLWNGRGWTQHTSPTHPSASEGAALAQAYDGSLLQLANNQLWFWTGAWTQDTTTVPLPTPAVYTASYDAQQQRTVLYGLGGGVARTWIHGPSGFVLGASGSTNCGASPCSDVGALSYVPPIAQVAWFPPTSTSASTAFSWGPSGWSPLPTAARVNAEAATSFDAATRKLVAIGGSHPVSNAVLLLDGTGASRAASVVDREGDGQPTPRFGSAVTQQPDAETLLLFGGETEASIRVQDTWIYDGGARARVAQILHVDLSDLGADDASVIGDEPDIASVAVRAVVGASGTLSAADNCVALAGVELLAWSNGGWRSLAENAAGPSSPGLLSWDSANAPGWMNVTGEALRRSLVFGQPRSMAFALRSRAPNGCGEAPAELVTDYVEARVRFRQPR